MAQLRRVNLEPWLVAMGTGGVVLLYCLRNGTYDLVTRGELSLLIWVALGLGWATGVLPREKPTRLLWVPVAGFLALAIWTTICLSWTESDERTVVELGRVVHHAGVFLLAASVLTRRNWRAALGGLTAALMIVAWLGLLNWLWPGSIAVDDVRRVFGVNRLSYPLDYFNGMATLGAMAIVAGLAWAAHAGSWWLRAAAILPVPGAVVMTYLTYSRGGALELAVALLAVVAFARHRAMTLLVGAVTAAGSALTILAVRDRPEVVKGIGSTGSDEILAYCLIAGLLAAALTIVLTVVRADERLRLPPRIGTPALAALALAGVVATAVIAPGLVRRAGEQLDPQPVNSAENPTVRFTTLGTARIPQFKAAVDVWRDHPVEGTGPGTFEFSWDRDPRYAGYVRDVHNLYLEALAESGVPGLLAIVISLVAIAALIVVAAVRLPSGPDRGASALAMAVLAAFAAAAAVDWAWELTALPVIALLAAGASAGALSLGRYRRSVRPSRVAIPIAAGLVLVATLPAMVSRSEVRESQAAARANQPDEALRHADDAIDAAPWSASAMAQKSLLLEAAGRLDDADGYARLAIDREPTNWRYALLRARLLALQGDAREAVDWYRRARTLAPRKPVLQLTE
jgi:O-antigen ligase/polysaccharide polymerase Wzy-like membrane protein